MMDHPLRAALAAELHARPFLRLAEAVSLTHYAIYADGQPDIHETLLHTLCRETGIAAPHDVLVYRREVQDEMDAAARVGSAREGETHA